MASNVDYALARKATLRDLRRGLVDRSDLCDAHPELLRAARHIGVRSTTSCPICKLGGLAHVRYAYGDRLRHANGRAIMGDNELERLGARHEEFTLYVVEVCASCGWNFLVTSYLLGKRHAG